MAPAGSLVSRPTCARGVYACIWEGSFPTLGQDLHLKVDRGMGRQLRYYGVAQRIPISLPHAPRSLHRVGAAARAGFCHVLGGALGARLKPPFANQPGVGSKVEDGRGVVHAGTERPVSRVGIDNPVVGIPHLRQYGPKSQELRHLGSGYLGRAAGRGGHNCFGLAPVPSTTRLRPPSRARRPGFIAEEAVKTP